MSHDLTPADVMAMNGNNEHAMWNNPFIYLVWLAVLGRGGIFGGNGAGDPAVQGAITRSDLFEGFNNQDVNAQLRGITTGLCDGFYGVNNSINSVLSAIQNCCCDTRLGMCQGFNGINQSIANLGYQTSQGFCGVDKAVMTSDFHNQAGFNAIETQLSSCCCDLSRGQENIKYALAQSTNDIIIANDKNTDRIINYLTQTEMDKLRTELQSAQFQLSQLSQTSNIVNQLMPVAKPAYITCSPYAAMMGYPYTNSCGCSSCA